MNQAQNGEIEAVTSQPEQQNPGLPPSCKTLMVGLDVNTGECRIEKIDAQVPTWEMVIAILSAALEVARFHRNMNHGAHVQAQAMKAMEEEQIRAALRQKGKLHV